MANLWTIHVIQGHIQHQDLWLATEQAVVNRGCPVGDCPYHAKARIQTLHMRLQQHAGIWIVIDQPDVNPMLWIRPLHIVQCNVRAEPLRVELKKLFTAFCDVCAVPHNDGAVTIRRKEAWGGMTVKRDGPFRKGLWKTLCVMLLMVFGLAALIVVDCAQYAHWRTPVFAIALSRQEGESRVHRSRGMWYETVYLEQGESRYQDWRLIWEGSDNICGTRAEDVFALSKEAVLQRHDASRIGYDDGTVGVWIAGCEPNATGATVYAIAMHDTDVGKVVPDGLSPERISIGYGTSGDLLVLGNEDATWEQARGFQDSSKLKKLFPPYVLEMWSVLQNR